jgi:copper resistance protein C
MKNNKNMFLTRIGALGAVVALLLPLPVFAHAILVKSQPAKDEVISVSPKQIDVWFNDKVGSEYKALAVIDSAGKRVDNKDVEQESGNEAHLYATLQNLAPGTYTVRYRVVSIDTHIITGKFQFSVKAP